MRLRPRPISLAGALALALGSAGCMAPSAEGPADAELQPTPTRAAMPGPASHFGSGAFTRPREINAALANAECERCHAAIAAEWRGSLHRQAHTGAAYQRALEIEPLAFCRGCHAPEADPRRDPPEELGALGVGCVTCHLTGDAVLAAPIPPGRSPLPASAAPRRASSAPHAVHRDPRFATAAACASCHEFPFPDAALRRRPELMQSTVSEHRRSASRDIPCASCHMPDAGGHRSHAFIGSRDEAFVRAAARVTAERRSAAGVRIVIEPVGIGHAFPTGDLFRRVEVLAEAVGVEYQVASARRAYLTRHFRDERLPMGGIARTVERDDRPLDHPRVIDVELDPEAASLPIAWRVAYQRVEHPRSDKEDDSLVEGEIVLGAGILPP